MVSARPLLRSSNACRYASKIPGLPRACPSGYWSNAAIARYISAGRSITIQEKQHRVDDWTNVPSKIIDLIPRRLHLQPSHPLNITRKLIEAELPSPVYTHYNDLSPVVSTRQNFDSLGFPLDHPGRSPTDTYYINAQTCLRTHTSAHQADTFRHNTSDGYTITADVYRRDAIDRSHYPVFHQMEGARLWERDRLESASSAQRILEGLNICDGDRIVVEDPGPTIHPERNPLQQEHFAVEVEAIANHLKRSIERVVLAIFDQARTAALAVGGTATAATTEEPLRVRWVEAYFPFTSPSWELEVFWQGDWLELLGCGVVKQSILRNAGQPHKAGWAFGLGLERLAMLLYSIPDIRLFWSTDGRFLSQFVDGRPAKRYEPFSKYPACPRDVAFWIPDRDFAGTQATAGSSFHENDVMQIIRDIGGDLVEQVRLVDIFRHPTTGRKSLCYNVNYRSLERVISRDEANSLHEDVRNALQQRLQVELR